jgi:hypothetical protein
MRDPDVRRADLSSDTLVG